LGYFWGVFVYSIKNGAADRLYYPMDFRGELCGQGKYTNKPYVYYIHPLMDTDLKICVESCPLSTGPDICLPATDGKTDTGFCYAQMQADEYLEYCMPVEPNNEEVVMGILEEPIFIFKRFLGDINRSVSVMVSSSLLSFFSACLIMWMLKFRKTSQIITFLSVILAITSFAISSYICYLRYEELIEERCLYQTDDGDCGGFQAYFFYVFLAPSHLCISIRPG
jgi:hypothetical protein